MLPFELLDPRLDLNQTHSYHLSILVNRDGLFFAILHPSRQKYIGLKGWKMDRVNTPDLKYEQISRIIGKDPLLQQAYASVSLIHTDPRSTLLPAALFNPEHLKFYFEFNQPLEDLEELHYNHIRQADAYLVFPVHHEIANLYLQTWVNARFYHQATPLVAMPGLSAELSETTVQLLLNPDHFDVIVNEGPVLKYHNNFSHRSDEDLLYFILMVFDRLSLDQAQTLVMICGDFDQISERANVLRSHFKRLAFRKLSEEFIYPPGMHRLQEHTLYHLLQVYHCG